MNNDNKRLSVSNLYDSEDRVSALEGQAEAEHSGTLTKNEILDLGDRITTLEGGTPTERPLKLSEMLYYDDRITALEEAKDVYTITYDLNGGTGSIDPVEVTEGDSVNLNDGSTITAPDTFTFAGWTTTKDDDTTKVTSPYTPTESITLFALYVSSL